jgi:hypothetical protein
MKSPTFGDSPEGDEFRVEEIVKISAGAVCNFVPLRLSERPSGAQADEVSLPC